MTRWRIVAVPLLAIAGGWLCGFIWFEYVTRQASEPPPPHVDGIVALTGGAGRVELALHLLAAGQADKLLVSGIGGNIDLATLGRRAGVDTASFADRVILGRYAASTRGNGVEAAAWAEQQNIRSLMVVTAAYHMPRALAEMRQALPNVQLYPLPVRPASGTMWGSKLEAEEYTKYLLTAVGLSVWFPRREPQPSLATLPGAGK